jgi:ribosomal-protein-alanine N-acetyltransferase
MSVIARLLARGAGSQCTIEEMRRRHLDAVLQIENTCHPTPWSRTVFMTELDQARSGARHYVVARLGRSVVGYAGVMFAPDEAHVTNVAVAPAHRRAGIATRLLLELAGVAIARGCRSWTLEVRVGSTGAQELYRRFGFAPAGIRQRYYENVEDAIVMWCHDIDGEAYAALLREITTELGA